MNYNRTNSGDSGGTWLDHYKLIGGKTNRRYIDCTNKRKTTKIELAYRRYGCYDQVAR